MAASSGIEFFEIDMEEAGELFEQRGSGLDAALEERAGADEEGELMWAAVERLPSVKRHNFAVVRRDSRTYSRHGSAPPPFELVDVRRLDRAARERVLHKAFATNDQDNYNLLAGIKGRFDSVGLDVPKVEVTFQNLTVSAEVHTGRRALPTLTNYVRDAIEGVFTSLRLLRPQKQTLTILDNVSGVIKPGRMTLLLGPPGSGKTTLHLALAGKLDSNLKRSGDVKYNGCRLDKFIVQRTSAYISQTDNHIGELTVRETLDFAARCQGASNNWAEHLKDLEKLEKEKNIRPTPEIDAFMKVASVKGENNNLATEYTLKVLGLDVCADTLVGSDMFRGVSGGQKKRVTTGEMIVGPRKTLFMDEISTGLDSSTTYQIVKCMLNFVHQMEATVLMSLLQPAPETFDLFDDLILLAEGHIIYHGPREKVLEFFETLGFSMPSRKGVADFLQEIFRESEYGSSVRSDLSVPNDDKGFLPSALARTNFAISKQDLLKACLSREVLLIIGFAPSADRFFCFMLLLFSIHQMALGLFRLMAALARDFIVANTFGSFALLAIFLLGGFIVPKDAIKPWWIWAYWISPLQYGQRAIAVNEFTDSRWIEKSSYGTDTVGNNVLLSQGLPTQRYWYWMGVGILLAYSILFNILFILAMAYLKPLGKAQAVVSSDSQEGEDEGFHGTHPQTATRENNEPEASKRTADRNTSNKGMILPFQPLSMTFHNVNYFVDMPKPMKVQGVPETRLQLLSNVSGVFRPRVLTALVGSSGAGKTTLMDVLAGRKTGGYIEGDIRISGYVKDQRTFARISGYVEQNDIHSPQVTVEESLWFSSSLRLSNEISQENRRAFVEEVMKLVELDTLRHALVGIPGSSGLSTEQRKRLTIAVELVANPSIIFMDEPTSGLDARAAAIVMRTVRNTVDTGRTVVCTIHQPSIDIFEAFDELLLMKRGGLVIYGGSLGRNSQDMINYFQVVLILKWGLEQEIRMSLFLWEVEALIHELSTPAAGTEPLRFVSVFPQDKLTQFKSFGMLAPKACIFLGVNNASSIQPVISIERTVYYRERATRMYASLPYAAAQGIVEIPYIMVQTIIFGLITFFMINYERTLGKFILYCLFMFLTFMYFTFYGMMAVGLTPTQQLAAVISSSCYSLWNLLSGFLIPKANLPVWWLWFYYICPVAWTLRGVITSQLGDVETRIAGPGFDGTVKQYLEESLGYGPGMLSITAVVLIAFSLVFFTAYAVSIKVLNYQRR
ncbi:Plant PDR ABC transporter associated [Musa troglodytarum]|uniref:Plant PDR ABC transporter associated n=1 Tax=Musa troglodytarum TaxID=320322 RepID=A0A9E7JH17_9LILI|nr:Plant PDR ABC transporter associated [Musa troglodytarum]